MILPGEGPSTRFKRGVDTPREPSARHTFDLKDLKKEDFKKRGMVYENHIDEEDLNNHIGGFIGLVQAQSWGMALMSILEKKVTLSQIRKFYYTFAKVNEGYYKAKVDRQ